MAAGLSVEQFEEMKKQLLADWEKAETRDQGFALIVKYGRQHGYKNVIAALEARVPKRFTEPPKP